MHWIVIIIPLWGINVAPVEFRVQEAATCKAVQDILNAKVLCIYDDKKP
jgi:hypothetical protein